jgi:hypothetical protein
MGINKVIKGDIVEMAKNGDFNIIIQEVNCFGTMETRIADELGGEHNSVRQADWDYPAPIGNSLRLGNYSGTSLKGTLIINAYTHFAPNRGERVDYESLEEVFSKLNDEIIRDVEEDLTIGIPVFHGCYEVIEAIINEAAPDLNIIVVEEE